MYQYVNAVYDHKDVITKQEATQCMEYNRHTHTLLWNAHAKQQHLYNLTTITNLNLEPWSLQPVHMYTNMLYQNCR